MREIVIDTETTGLDCNNGDRVIEVGCVELLNHISTGRTFHKYINPGRAVAADAVNVHGLTDAFLRDQPSFETIADELIAFLGDSVLVAHNAGFDRDFINMELDLCGRAPIEADRFVDTLLLARRRHPNGPNNLDALCARYGIDNSARTKHGALLDSEILAEVYLELIGGRQATLELASIGSVSAGVATIGEAGARPRPLAPRLTPEDVAAHETFLGELGSDPLWNRYRGQGEAGAP